MKMQSIYNFWFGGDYGTGDRMKLKYMRAMITAALSGELDKVNYHTDKFFGMHIPETCPGVPANLLDPQGVWKDKTAYHKSASTVCTYILYRKF